MSLFIGRLRTGIATEPLKAHFEQYGPLLRFEYRGMYAFVTYETDDQALRCMEQGRFFGSARMKIEWAKESKNYDGPRRQAAEGCFVCLEVGHFARECPNRFRTTTFNSQLVDGYESYSDRFQDEKTNDREVEPLRGRSGRAPPRGASDRGGSKGGPGFPPPAAAASYRHGHERPLQHSPSPPRPQSPPSHRDFHRENPAREFHDRGSPPRSYRGHPVSPRGAPSSSPAHSYRDYGDHNDSYSREPANRDRRRESEYRSPDRRDHFPHHRARGGHYDRERRSDAYRSSSPRGGRMGAPPQPRYDEFRGREGGHRRSPSPSSPGSPRQKRTRSAHSPAQSPVRFSDDKKPRAS